MTNMLPDLVTPSKLSSDDLFGMSSSPTTPSPCMSISTSNNSSSRRPPRKSTLTQQQKNQKRQRATQEQLNLLEVEFNKNPTPTAVVREKIATEINMTERSVQIWFQNRYVLCGHHADQSTNHMVDARRLRTSPREVLRLAKIAMPFPSQCESTSPCRPWIQGNHSLASSLSLEV